VGINGSQGFADIEKLRRRFAAHGQDHVFRFWERLDGSQQQELARQAQAIDLEGLRAALAAAREVGPSRVGMRPPPAERLPERGGNAERWSEAKRRGEALLRSGRVAALVVAGGQATRLGFPGPKGAFPLGPITERSLFAIQGQKLRRARERSGQPLRWYVMTSPATDAATRAFFAEHDCFGVPPGDVFFFEQATVPCFDLDGRLMLAEAGKIASNPDGHGGSLTALLHSGALDDMERRGITTLFYYQVDNPLVRMLDPTLLGFHATSSAEVSCKVVRKQDPLEKVGIVAQLGDALGVVEYSELDDELRQRRDDAGELVYWAGNIAIHVFETRFVRRLASEAERWLPFHVAEKTIPTIDDAGQPIQPETPNGRKLERFVFDALPAAKRVCVVEAERAQEFSPVKNPSGSDSPETARQDLAACYAAWLEAAGIDVPAGTALEIDHSRIDGPEDAIALGFRSLGEAGDIVRTQPGARA